MVRRSSSKWAELFCSRHSSSVRCRTRHGSILWQWCIRSVSIESLSFKRWWCKLTKRGNSISQNCSKLILVEPAPNSLDPRAGGDLVPGNTQIRYPVFILIIRFHQSWIVLMFSHVTTYFLAWFHAKLTIDNVSAEVSWISCCTLL